MTFKEYQDFQKELTERAVRKAKKNLHSLDIARLKIYWKETSDGNYVIRLQPIKLKTK